MNAKGRRLKGNRGEYTIRNYLRGRGFVANRVPCSGAAQGFKCDVTASKDGVEYKLEVKSRAFSVFKTIYDLYNSWVEDPTGGLALVHESFLIGVSTEFERLLTPTSSHFLRMDVNRCKTSRTAHKIHRMRKWLGEADTLAIIGNHKPPLFIRYYV